MSELSKKIKREAILHQAKRDRVLIEVYRDFEITFDKGTSTFNAFSDRRDYESNCKSFDAAKRHIDSFLKENENFVQFKVREHNRHSQKFGELLTVIGRRKDGGFRAKTVTGASRQISKNYLKNYVLDSSIDKKIQEKIMTIKSSIAALNDEISKLTDIYKLIPIDKYIKLKENDE